MPKLRKYMNSSGDVGYYQDDYGGHLAVVIIPGATRSGMLFVTSNKFWNKRSRILSIEEMTLLGMPLRDRQNYFAPVFRDNDFFYKEDFSFPRHRVISLVKEFWPILCKKKNPYTLLNIK